MCLPDYFFVLFLIFVDMLTEENEKFIEFGIGGLSNCSLGK